MMPPQVTDEEPGGVRILACNQGFPRAHFIAYRNMLLKSLTNRVAESAMDERLSILTMDVTIWDFADEEQAWQWFADYELKHGHQHPAQGLVWGFVELGYVFVEARCRTQPMQHALIHLNASPPKENTTDE